jgi:isopentenyl-diphosphate delta-isomerase
MTATTDSVTLQVNERTSEGYAKDNMSMTNTEYVILVDEQDNEIGTMEKMQAHEEAKLHRAFSVFVFNDAGEVMIHRRALHKYHSGGLWTNACCSHPRKGETVLEAAHRRLMEEMGFDCELEQQFSFIYKAELDNELTEHELDHVVFGKFNGLPNINPDEVADWKFLKWDDLKTDVANRPEHYTAWFKIALEEVDRRYQNQFNSKS